MPKEIRIPIYSFKTTELAKNMSVVHVFEDWAPQKDFTWFILLLLLCSTPPQAILLPTFEAALAGEISYGTNMSVPRVPQARSKSRMPRMLCFCDP